LFVDPIVRKETNKPLSIASLSSEKEELGKFTSSASSLISILRNQANVKEQGKISEILQNFKLKDDLVSFYAQTQNLHTIFSTSFVAIVLKKIQQKVANDSISLSSDSIIKYFNKKLKEINEEVKINKVIEMDNSEMENIYEIKSFKNKSIEDVLTANDLEKIDALVLPTILNEDTISSAVLKELEGILEWSDEDKKKTEEQKNVIEEGKREKMFELLQLSSYSDRNRFFQAVLLIFTELTLKTLGKYPEAKRIPILPIDSDHNLIDLPGSEIEAFAGFSSEKSREYAFEYGKYSAIKTLAYDKIREGYEPYLEITKVKSVLKDVESRLNQVNFFQHNRYSKDLLGLSDNGVTRIVSLISPGYLKTLKYTGIATLLSPVSLTFGIVKVLPMIVRKLAKKMLGKGIKSVESLFLSPIQISIENVQKKSNTLIVRTEGDKKIKIDLKNVGEGRRVGRLFVSKAHPELGLIAEEAVHKPNGIDPNIAITKYNEELRKKIMDKRIVSIELRRILRRNIKLRNPNEDFKTTDAGLVSNLLNPTLRIRNSAEATWELIDNTTPLYLSLLKP